MSNAITYVVMEGDRAKLSAAAKMACNMWNRLVHPSGDIVVRLETFYEDSRTTATAWVPWTRGGVKYGRVSFNTHFLDDWSPLQAAQTLAHEIGHVLGFGFSEWWPIVDTGTGRFTLDAIRQVPALADMRIELEGPKGVRWSHWDEDGFDDALMTPYKDSVENVLPVTVATMRLLGHDIREELDAPISLDDLLKSPPPAVDWTKKTGLLDRTYFEETDVFETIPHRLDGDDDDDGSAD